MSNVRSSSYSISVSAGYIAATAKANSMIVATTDTSPFDVAGLRPINPWTSAIEDKKKISHYAEVDEHPDRCACFKLEEICINIIKIDTYSNDLSNFATTVLH